MGKISISLVMQKRYQKVALSQYLVVTLIIFVVIGFGFVFHLLMTNNPFFDEFAIPWAAGRAFLLEGESPYSPLVVQKANLAIDQSIYLAQLPKVQFLEKPILTLLFYLPFSLMPYAVGRVIWVTMLGVCIGLIGFFSIKLSDWPNSIGENIFAIFLILSWLPSVNAVLIGGMAPLIMFLLLAAIVLIINGQDTLSGLILSLTISSFPRSGLILIALIIWALSRKRWQILTGVIAGLSFLLTVFWLIAPSWFMDWVAMMLKAYEGWGWINTPLVHLAGLLPGIARHISIFLHGTFLVLFIVIIGTGFGQTKRQFIYKFFLIFTLSYFVYVDGTINNLIMLIPALFIVFKSWSELRGKFGQILGWVILTSVTVGPWLLSIKNINFSEPMNSLFLLAGFPIFVLISLLWVYPWGTKNINLQYNNSK